MSDYASMSQGTSQSLSSLPPVAPIHPAPKKSAELSPHPQSSNNISTEATTKSAQQQGLQMGEEAAGDENPEYLLEYIDEPGPSNQGLDSDEVCVPFSTPLRSNKLGPFIQMDVENLLTSTPPVQDEARSFPRTGSLLSDDETEELVAATPEIPSTTRASSPDPLDMDASSSPGQPVPLAGASSLKMRRSSRRSSVSSNDPISLFANEESLDTPPKTRSSSPYDSSKVVAIKTFGGFPSLNWKTFRQDVNNFAQKCYFAKDLPHELQDHINRWSPTGQRYAGLRTVLECYIQENTADDEPDAPNIEIINDVDDDPTPPWEFHYSNKMWHGEGVPPPDVSKLTSCGCTGKCDPKSKTCACLKRQQRYTGTVIPDFAYDGKARLKTIDYPIFECNDLCGCDEECRNRVCSS
jgi:hypothetical protein